MKTRKKGFTLVELLVVIAIIAMLLAILMPALGRVRQLAYRMMCGTNLSGLGKAILTYSNDNDEDYPQAGGKLSDVTWTTDIGTFWTGETEDSGDMPWTTAGTSDVTVTSCWFLLVKYVDVSPAQFICQSSDKKKWEIDPQVTEDDTELDMTECWDFGETPIEHVSYAMQNPFSSNAATASTRSGIVIAGDMNPWFDNEGEIQEEAAEGQAPGMLDIQSGETVDDLDRDQIAEGNCESHQGEGQELLYNDMHVAWAKNACAGINDDNVYTSWVDGSDGTEETDYMVGDQPTDDRSSDDDGTLWPENADDTMLVI